MFEFEGVNSALVGMSKELLKNGKHRKTRGFDCIEIPHPIIIKLNNPRARHILIKERKWNWMLPYAESLWMALGWNNLNDLPGFYVKKLYDFSDDGETWRAGYGSRLRYYSPSKSQYNIGKYEDNIELESTDQFEYILEAFKRDSNTRQAIITIADPNKDSFAKSGYIIQTKDYPCTRELHFMKNTEGRLDLIVKMRSNDLLWGATAVNFFNFTFMLEYFSFMLDIPVGNYYHIVDNFHVYENFLEDIKLYSSLDLEEVKEMDTKQNYNYSSKLSLNDFDKKIRVTELKEKEFRYGKYNITEQDEFFHDWQLVFAYKNAKIRGEFSKLDYNFFNPILTSIVS